MASTDPSLSEYWAGRARSSFWATRMVSYRAGTVLAFVLGRMGLRPNHVSALSLISCIVGLVAVLRLFGSTGAQAIGIFLVLNFSYALDCADGLLARVKGLGTRFGAFFDKFIDVLVQAVIVGVLVYFSESTNGRLIDLPAELLVAFSLGARLSLCVLLWLKEFEGRLPQRVSTDERRRDLMWYFRRGAGLIGDQPIYFFVISIAWAGGFFLDALLVYHLLIALLSIGYLGAIYREDGIKS